MKQLRDKLETDPVRPKQLITEIGVDYRLAAGDPPEDRPSLGHGLPFLSSWPSSRCFQGIKDATNGIGQTPRRRRSLRHQSRTLSADGDRRHPC